MNIKYVVEGENNELIITFDNKNDAIDSNRNSNPRFFKIFTKGLTKLAIKVSKKL